MNNKRKSFKSFFISLILVTFFSIMILDFPSVNVTIAKTLKVGPPGSGYKYSRIGYALCDADDGDEVIVYDGSYYECFTLEFLKNITVRSVNGPDVTIVLCDDMDYDGHLMVFGDVSSIVLDGFTIQLPYSFGTSGASWFRVLIYPPSSLTIKNCILTPENFSTEGYAIYCEHSSPTLINCVIKGFETMDGAIHCEYSSPKIINCTISENDWSGIYLYESSPTIINSIINNNDSSGIRCDRSSPMIINSIIINNNGSGIDCSDSSPKIINCTISNNKQGIGYYNASLSIINSIVWGNSIDQLSSYPGSRNTLDIQYSDIQGGFDDPHIFGDPNINSSHSIDKDPLFIDANAGNFYLQPNSPCIDRGTNNVKVSDDKDGTLRPLDGDKDGIAQCDIGAYEFMEGIHVFPQGKIQKAINNANNGDIIIIHPGRYRENINFSGKDITVTSTNPKNKDVVDITLIDANQKGSVVTFNQNEGNTSILKGLTLRNGRASNGGGIYCSCASPLISNCTISNNSALNYGGGIYCYNAAPSIIKCEVINNIATINGGGIYYSIPSSSKIKERMINKEIASDGSVISSSSNSFIHITNVLLQGNMVKESANEFCLDTNSRSYCDIELLHYKNASFIQIQISDQQTKKWRPYYNFFGKPCGIDSIFHSGDFLFISLLKE